jgi:hypothetical protein
MEIRKEKERNITQRPQWRRAEDAEKRNSRAQPGMAVPQRKSH